MMTATSTYTPRNDAGQFVSAKVTPAVRASVQAAAQLMFDESQQLVPVRTGALKDSGSVVIADKEKTVVGNVQYSAFYATYVEYGTGRRGDPTAPYGHVESWPGMDAHPFMRPALDTTRQAVKELFAGTMSEQLR
jgi:HK97 gp10 family phage protein